MGLTGKSFAPTKPRGYVSPHGGDDDGWYADHTGWKCCCVHWCGWLACLWFIVFPFLVMQTVWLKPWHKEPGNEIRKEIHADVVRGLNSNSFHAVEEKYKKEVYKSMSCLAIGDQAGVRWYKEEGRKMNDRYPMLSQTKILTALLIYRVMQHMQQVQPGSFGPHTYVHEILKSWPNPDGHSFGSMVQMKHLLSMTSGFMADYYYPGCVYDVRPKYKRDYTPQQEEDQSVWEKCMTEIALYEFRYEPGTVFNYGPWHLYVAAGATLKLMNKPLTRESWEELMDEFVYKPSGIWTRPKFTDVAWYGHELPDVNTGMMLSADEWTKIIHQLQFGNLLDPYHRGFFMQDHTNSVTQIANDVKNATGQYYRDLKTTQNLQGSWHYAQGHWIACNAITSQAAKDRYDDGKPDLVWQESNSACGFTDSRMNPGFNGVHHSSGEGGSFIWFDEYQSHKYFGVYIQYYDWALVFFNGCCALLFMSFCCCCMSSCIALQVNYKKMLDETLKE